jgi:hypothetical protein
MKRNASILEKRAYLKAWHARNPDRHLLYKNRWLAKSGVRARVTTKRRAYKLGKLEQQGRAYPFSGCCDVCGQKPAKKRLAFDHDHTTGAFRGWLCHGCNLILGFAEDSPQRLRALAKYLDNALLA